MFIIFSASNTYVCVRAHIYSHTHNPSLLLHSITIFKFFLKTQGLRKVVFAIKLLIIYILL